MRKTQMGGNEILAAEKAADERRQNRNSGYSLMHERDRGHARLTPRYNSANEVFMHWGVDESTLFELEIRPYNGKTIHLVLDAEELRKSLRWV